MRIFLAATVAACSGFAALPALADATTPVTIYPYHSSVNYCPAGLQPVTFDGVVSCGRTTETQSYQQALRHPARSRARYAGYDCQAGTKGCN